MVKFKYHSNGRIINMSKTVDISEIASLARLSLSKDELTRAEQEIREFAEYIKILEDYCDTDTICSVVESGLCLRNDEVCVADEAVRAFEGYVNAPLSRGGEE